MRWRRTQIRANRNGNRYRRVVCRRWKNTRFQDFLVLPRNGHAVALRAQSVHASPRAARYQKLNVACRSMRRLAAPDEKGPACSALAVSKNGEPRIPLGFARFTVLKTLRAEMPRMRL